jgi:hypothetical protein
MVATRAPREVIRKAVAALYDRRRAARLCIKDNRDQGGEPHSPPTKNKRRSDGGFDLCDACYADKLARKRKGGAS